MSDVQKPVEETPAAAPAAETTETPAAEAPKDTPAENTEAAAPAETAEAAAEQPKEEDKKEVTPATDGVLGYKAPGLVKGLRFTKRYFYFSDEAIESKNLSAFLQNEKSSVAHPIAAWATQTGKGLLFFAKRAEDKATPAGIFNLADVTEVTKEGSNELVFKINGHKHTLQASSADERDSWVAAIEAKSAEAKAEKDTITASEGYKAELEKLSKPAEGAEEDKDKANTKSRSQSRKRTSVFGNIIGKKETEKKEAKEDKPEEAKTEGATEAPAEGAAAEATAEEAPAAESSEDKKEEKKADDKKAKRASLFGNFFQKVTSPTTEKPEKEAPIQESTVSSTAPQLENPVEESSKPAEEAQAAPAETEASKDAAAAPESPAPETTPKDKRRTSFFGGLGIKKDGAEGEGKGKKLGGLFRKPSKAVKGGDKDKEVAPAETIPEGDDKPEPVSKDAPAEDKPAEEGAKAEDKAEVPAETVNVASTSTPVQAAA